MTQNVPSMSATGINVLIEDKCLLDNVSCTLPGRGITGLVGQNGSGKSTFMRVLARQLRPQGGKVTFAGQDIVEYSDRSFARDVAYLPQSAPVAPGMTVRELVSLGRYPWHGALGRFGDEDARHVEDALALTETTALSDRLVDSLSGGERQRCWLAMLLAQGARLLLLDEPTSALDLQHQHSTLRLLRKVCQERGIAVIIIIHDINLAASFCDHIVALKTGRLIDEGSPAEIMTPARLESIFDVRMLVTQHPQTGAPYCIIDASA